MRTIAVALWVALVALALPSCAPRSPGAPDGPSPQTRTFSLGFTDFPHNLHVSGILAAFDVIRREGDLVVLHFDDGVPWQEALAGTAYPGGYLAELDGKASLLPAGHEVYLAITPLAIDRDGLARNRGDAGDQPLPPPWDRRGLDDPAVIQAFLAHANRMIDGFDPDFFVYAVEVNLLLEKAPEEWDAFVVLAEAVYTTLKREHPGLPVILTLQAESFHRDPGTQRARVPDVLPFTDFVAVSAYPYIAFDDPRLPADYFQAIAELAPGKPFAISETGWPAETVGPPYPFTRPGSPEAQRGYLDRVLAEADRRNARFVCWFFTRDYDDAWESTYKYLPGAATLRFFRDLGLLDGGGTERPGLTAWREVAVRRLAR